MFITVETFQVYENMEYHGITKIYLRKGKLFLSSLKMSSRLSYFSSKRR